LSQRQVELKTLHDKNHYLRNSNKNRNSAIMEKIQKQNNSGSQNDGKGYLLGTFFRDRGEELLLKGESSDRSKTDLIHGTHLRNDYAIVEMLYEGEADASFLPDRIEVHSIGQYQRLLEQSDTD
jgi:hypothetical protein